MTEQGVALLFVFFAFCLLILVLAWDPEHKCRFPNSAHRKEK